MIGWVRVWERSAFAGSDDGFKSRAVGSKQAHAIFDLGGQIDFGHIGLELFESLFERDGVEANGSFDGSDLAGALAHAQRFDASVHRFQANILQHAPELRELFEADAILLERERAQLETPRPFADFG